MANEQDNARTEDALRKALSAAYGFVRSREASAGLSAFTLDDLIAEAIVQIDRDQIPEGTSTTSVDSTGRSLFVITGEESSLVRREGALQRLVSMSGAVLSRAQFSQIFPRFDVPDDIQNESLFDALRDAPPIKDEGAPERGVREETNKLTTVKVSFTVGDQVITKEIQVPQDLLTPQAREENGSIKIDSSFLDGGS